MNRWRTACFIVWIELGPVAGWLYISELPNEGRASDWSYRPVYFKDLSHSSARGERHLYPGQFCIFDSATNLSQNHCCRCGETRLITPPEGTREMKPFWRLRAAVLPVRWQQLGNGSPIAFEDPVLKAGGTTGRERIHEQ